MIEACGSWANEARLSLRWILLRTGALAFLERGVVDNFEIPDHGSYNGRNGHAEIRVGQGLGL